VTIVVRNPLDPAPGEREGNRLALANIRERLSLMYGGRALMKSGRFDAEVHRDAEIPAHRDGRGAAPRSRPEPWGRGQTESAHRGRRAPARERLRSLLAEIADVEVIGEAANGHEALRETHDLAPDVVLLDVRSRVWMDSRARGT